MRNTTLLIIILILPFLSLAQYEHSFTTPPSAKSRLIPMGEHTIFIEPLDAINQNQKWITFDSALNTITQKKMVTPGAANLVQQNYLQAKGGILRVDQYLDGGHLLLSAFLFDARGNLLYANDLSANTADNNGITASSFFISQSADKGWFALVQSNPQPKDSLTVAAIVFNDTLGINTNAIFKLPYNAEMYDVYAPFISDNGTLCLAMANRFDSYILSSDLKIFSLTKAGSIPLVTDLAFDRKKIKNLHFTAAQDTVFFTALFSNSKEDKDEVAGVLQSSFIVGSTDPHTVEEHLFSSETKQQLKKTFGGENRKGSLTNYISVMPGAFANNGQFNHAILLPTQHSTKPHGAKSGSPQPGDKMVVRKVVYTTSVVTTQPIGSAGITLLPGNITGSTGSLYPLNSSIQNTLAGMQLPAPGGGSIPASRNLLYYSFSSNEGKKDHQFIRLKPVADARHGFFTYYKNNNGYGALHYIEPAIKQPYLNSIFITNEGVIEEKKILEDKNRIIPAGFDFIVTGTSLTAFYVDKQTGAVGLMKLKL